MFRNQLALAEDLQFGPVRGLRQRLLLAPDPGAGRLDGDLHRRLHGLDTRAWKVEGGVGNGFTPAGAGVTDPVLRKSNRDQNCDISGRSAGYHGLEHDPMEHSNGILDTDPFHSKMKELFGKSMLDTGCAITDIEAAIRNVMGLADQIIAAQTKEEADEPLTYLWGEFEHIRDHAEEAVAELKSLIQSLD